MNIEGVNLIKWVLGVRETWQRDGHFGPYIAIIPVEYGIVLNQRYYTDVIGSMGDRTVKDRILQIHGIKEIKIANVESVQLKEVVEFDKEAVRDPVDDLMNVGNRLAHILSRIIHKDHPDTILVWDIIDARDVLTKWDKLTGERHATLAADEPLPSM